MQYSAGRWKESEDGARTNCVHAAKERQAEESAKDGEDTRRQKHYTLILFTWDSLGQLSFK